MGAMRRGEEKETWKVSTKARARLPPASLRVRAEIPLSPLHNPLVQGGKRMIYKALIFIIKANFKA